MKSRERRRCLLQEQKASRPEQQVRRGLTFPAVCGQREQSVVLGDGERKAFIEKRGTLALDLPESPEAPREGTEAYGASSFQG